MRTLQRTSTQHAHASTIARRAASHTRAVVPSAAAALDVTYWHGSSRVVGDTLTPQDTPSTRSGDPDGWVYITTSRDLAATYAATVDGPAWLYEVEPLSNVERDPGSLLDYSLRCRSARIVRRFTISNRERVARRRSVGHFFWR